MEPLWIAVLNVGGIAGLGAYITRFVITKVWKTLETRDTRTHELLTNHLQHNTDAMHELTLAVRELREEMRRGRRV